MDDALKDRVRALEDREAIRELRSHYCFLVDEGRFDELVDRHFTEDAACDFGRPDSEPFFVGRGRENIRPFFAKTVPSLLRSMSHTVHNHRIVLDGDQASGDCYFELTATHQESGDPIVGGGRYMDRYRRTPDGWRFQERRAEILFMAPLLEGWERRRFIPGLA